MEILLPELLESFLFRLDALSFRSFGCVSTQFYDAICAFPTKPKKIKRQVGYGLVGAFPFELGPLHLDALFSGHLRLVSDVFNVETLSFDFLLFLRLFDVIETRHAEGTLPERKMCEFSIFNRIAYSDVTPRFLYWFFTTFTEEANWFFLSPPADLRYGVLNKIISIAFLHPDRHDALTALFIQRIPNLFDYVVVARGTFHLVMAAEDILFMDALYSGRSDTMQWVHQQKPSAIVEFGKKTLGFIELGRAKDTDVLSFMMENATGRTFTVYDVVLATLKIPDGRRVWEIFNARMERLDIYTAVPTPSKLEWIGVGKTTVASFKAAMEALTRLYNKLFKHDLERDMKAFASVLLSVLVRKCNNFTLFRYVLQQPLKKELLVDWPSDFFTEDRGLHRQDLKYFKLLLARLPEAWESFVHNRDKEAVAKYHISSQRTATDVYRFIRLARVEDSKLYLAYCMELKRPCGCCKGKCLQ